MVCCIFGYSLAGIVVVFKERPKNLCSKFLGTGKGVERTVEKLLAEFSREIKRHASWYVRHAVIRI